MKRLYHIVLVLPFLLWLVGCDQTRPDLIENIFFSDNDDWLVRDAGEDPYELVEGDSCNDYNPYPLPINTTIDPVIAPAGDLDYFDLQIASDSAAQLFLSSERDNVSMRLFDQEMEEYEFLLDTLSYSLTGDVGPVYWTTLYGHQDTTFTLLITGDSRKAQGTYNLGWQRVNPAKALSNDLGVVNPSGQVRWHRGAPYTIRWNLNYIEPVTLVLMEGPVVVDIIKRDILFIKLWEWTPDEDLEPGNDYRIMVYLSDDPTTLDISDAFEID